LTDSKVKSFQDLKAWQLARELRNKIYPLVDVLPDEEKYNLKSQLRRAAVSVTANIAEGYGRYHYQENIQFCRVARGSLYEIQDHLFTCKDLGYLEETTYTDLNDLSFNAIRTLDGYIRYLNSCKK
jgi:four helix bundle protein